MSKRPSHLVLYLLIAVLAASIAIGCGGEDENGQDAATSEAVAGQTDGRQATDRDGEERSDGGAQQPESDGGKAAGAGGREGPDGSSSSEPSGERGGTAQGDGESEQSPARGEGASRVAQFVRKADAVCSTVQERIQRQIQAYIERSASAGGITNIAPAMVDDVIVPRLREEMRAIQALEAPGAAAQAQAVAASSMGSLMKAARANPEKFVLEGVGVKQAERAARSKGFASCGALAGK